MEIVYLIAAGACWVAVVLLALGCERLQQRKAAP